MNFERGKIRRHVVGPPWRVRHYAYRAFLPPPAVGLVDVVGAESDKEAKERIAAAYFWPRVIVSVERGEA